MPLFRGLPHPLDGFRDVPPDAAALLIRHAELRLRPGMALLRGLVKPLQRRARVLLGSLQAPREAPAQLELRLRIRGLRGGLGFRKGARRARKREEADQKSHKRTCHDSHLRRRFGTRGESIRCQLASRQRPAGGSGKSCARARICTTRAAFAELRATRRGEKSRLDDSAAPEHAVGLAREMHSPTDLTAHDVVVGIALRWGGLALLLPPLLQPLEGPFLLLRAGAGAARGRRRPPPAAPPSREPAGSVDP